MDWIDGIGLGLLSGVVDRIIILYGLYDIGYEIGLIVY